MTSVIGASSHRKCTNTTREVYILMSDVMTVLEIISFGVLVSCRRDPFAMGQCNWKIWIPPIN